MKSLFIIAGLCLLLVNTSAQAELTFDKKEILTNRCCTLITHASGALNGNTYLNSRESLQRHLEMGERLIEIDFLPTSDGVWVGMHQWDEWRQRRHKGGQRTVFQTAKDWLMGSRAPSFAEVQSHKMYGSFESGTADIGYTALTISDLEQAVKKYPDLRIITDTKVNVRRLHETLEKTALKNHLIYQAYGLEDMHYMRAQGLNAILTLYKIKPENIFSDIPHLVKDISEHRKNIVAITMPLKRAVPNDYALLRQLKDAGFAVLLHGTPENINSHELHETLARLGANGFYLD